LLKVSILAIDAMRQNAALWKAGAVFLFYCGRGKGWVKRRRHAAGSGSTPHQQPAQVNMCWSRAGAGQARKSICLEENRPDVFL